MQLKPSALSGFHTALLGWYKTHGRHDLPWRNTDDAYAIWVSETMLQQTQVATVRDRFYGRFLERFPTIGALANAPEEAVMKAWEGLGYYRRARMLHAAAKLLFAQGGFPPAALPPALRGSPKATHDLAASLIALPGIGRNTAHAIMAFAYHAPHAILEANVKRIVARIFALETPKDDELWAGAESLLNPAHPFDHNQAMMDLGSLVCTPKKPDCPTCPANAICEGKHAPENYPQKKAKKATPTRSVNIIVLHDGKGRLALEARDAALLGGLYGFTQMAPHTALPKGATKLGSVRHVYSHFKLEGDVYLAPAPKGHNRLYSATEITTLPLSGLDHKVLALVSHHMQAK